MSINTAEESTISTDLPFKMGPQESKYRLVQPGFLTPEECSILSEFTRKNCVIGDGYGGDPHPHTPTETFAGITIDNNFAHPEQPEYQLALQVMMRARNQLMRHFGLLTLWLDYGHLVSRTAVTSPETQVPEDEYSHPWHYDNQSEGVKYRTHTAILYINDGFEGGHTCFKEAEFGPYREVTPQAGSLVGFSVADNAHAVTKLLTGERFVLNMWFSTHWRKVFRHRRNFRLLKK